ncbi:MAG: hypothetical protein OP8BY_0064 [Candidatus Saccharicenans subterraneus]|uniref:Uncharacterized protein n=1 Tax=Candidatus Saccharicenans subterraneus TaxID=2508984 RepID=A0A3E2BLQ2_9BACT|nr:MAG: hypothetical protein OP8BY_0064 [Candidatus Saccharicenans subterraneum]
MTRLNISNKTLILKPLGRLSANKRIVQKPQANFFCQKLTEHILSPS